jgi:hypothetical protein
MAVGKDENKEMKETGERNPETGKREEHLPITKLSLGKYLSTGVLAYTRLEEGML